MAQGYWATSKIRCRWAPGTLAGALFRASWRLPDGSLMIGVGNEPQWQLLRNGRPDGTCATIRAATNKAQSTISPRPCRASRRRLRTAPVAEWKLRRCRAAGIPLRAIHTLGQALTDPQVQFQSVTHPELRIEERVGVSGGRTVALDPHRRRSSASTRRKCCADWHGRGGHRRPAARGGAAGLMWPC